MLSISLTPTRLYFRELSDELQILIQELFDLQHDKQGFFIEDEPKNLYKVLLKLSYTYDIEIY